MTEATREGRNKTQSQQKEEKIIKIRAEIKEIETKKTERPMKQKAGSLKR